MVQVENSKKEKEVSERRVNLLYQTSTVGAAVLLRSSEFICTGIHTQAHSLTVCRVVVVFVVENQRYQLATRVSSASQQWLALHIYIWELPKKFLCKI